MCKTVFHLPEAHTDFVFKPFGQRKWIAGFGIGDQVILMLVYRCLSIGYRAEHTGRFLRLIFVMALVFTGHTNDD